MRNEKNIDRRNLLKLLTAAGLTSVAGSVAAQPGVGVMMPGKGWLAASGEACEGDGTPLQFIPKTQPDPDPLTDELKKYPKCPYCGMDRTKWHHSRHLVHYDDDLVDGTCSIHCLAISLSLNIDRGPKAIYAADFAATDEIKPLTNADQASYLLGSKLRGTMTANSKMAFADKSAAEKAQKTEGGKLVDFDDALRQAYADMADDTLMTRKRRAEKRKKMQMKMKQRAG
ncbi:MAG: nitrous oxide reductase accessory protein NosL [Chromatiales bacterium]|jgi:nitrous oxide reductase accessory protein NosL